MRSALRIFSYFIVAIISLPMLAACGKQSDAPTASAGPGQQVGVTRQYDWYMQGRTPAGETTIVKTGDGRITNESFVHWNNREWSVNSEIQLDEDGFIVSQRITGISPFKAPIDETFSYADGVATWSTPGESGSVNSDVPKFYLPNEGLSLGATSAAVRAALASIDNEIELFPTGSARVEKVSELDVKAPAGQQTLSLYQVSGISFTPFYAWFDDDVNLVAVDSGGYLGMIPKGWDVSILQELSSMQTEIAASYAENMAGGLAHSLDTPLIFENVDVVDVVNGELLENRHVMVEGGVIAEIAAAPIESADARRIDAEGKSLLPGLWDMHGHFGLEDGLLNIAGGITNVRDIGSVHEKILETTDKYDSGAVIGPNTWRSGFIDKAGPYASGWAAENLEQALERVDFFAEHGYIQIKLYSSIEPEWVAPIAERARAHGMRLSGHIPAYMSAEQAIQAGYNEIQHINMVFLNFLAGDREDTRQQIRFTLYGDEAGNLDLDSEEVEDFIALLREKDIVIDPTAAIFETMLVHLPGVPDPSYEMIIDHLPPAISRSYFNPEFDIRDTVETWARSSRNQAAMLKKLHDSGVQLVPGSDAVAAFTIHRELELYAEAGIPVAEVLRIGTLDSARVVGVDEKKGSIEVGKDSDLLLVEGNPLEDISAIRNGVLVMKGNTVYQPDELYKTIGVKPFLESVAF
jgi:imidazolonepropionase-like amidohydrolase